MTGSVDGEWLAPVTYLFAEHGSKLPETDPVVVGRARDFALRALGRRARSRREVEDMLRANDFSPEVATGVCAELEREGFIGDAALAGDLVRSLAENRGLGSGAIAAELGRRLLDPAAVELALAEFDADEERLRAVELAKKYALRLTLVDRDTALRRLVGYLARRGYPGSVVRFAAEYALNQNR